MAITDQSREAPASSSFQRFFKDLGPGVITGAADDDPSGISTYSVAGRDVRLHRALDRAVHVSSHGGRAVDVRAAWNGHRAGSGRRDSKTLFAVDPVALLLLIADREYIQYRSRPGRHGRCDANGDWSRGPISGRPCSPALIVALLFLTSYRDDGPRPQMVDAGVVRLRHHRVSGATGLAGGASRHVHSAHSNGPGRSCPCWSGIFGTTISPYLFFWQAAEEVEEDRERGKSSVTQRRGSTDEELAIAKKDVITGMAFSNLVMYFIILTTAATLHAHGITKIDTAQQAGGSPASPRRSGRLLVVHPRPDRHRDACRPGAGWILRLCDRRVRTLALGIPQQEAAPGSQILRHNRHFGVRRPGAQLRWIQRHQDAVLVRRSERGPRATTGHSHRSADQRFQSDG